MTMLTALHRLKTVSKSLLVIGMLSPSLLYALPSGVKEITSIEGVTEYQLENGLKVLFAPDASRPNTTVNMTYLVGSRHENYGQTGMAHLLEHMLFRGTPTMPNALGEFSKRGLAANGTTSSDRTNYYATFAANPETLNWYLDWQADVMVNATISKADLDAEMTVVRNEMERGENSPFRVLMQQMQAAAFQWHNYGKSTIGARSDVEQVDIEQLREFYKLYYQPDNAVLIVSGRFDEDATIEHIAKQFNAIKKPERSLPPEYTDEPVQDGARAVTIRRHGGSPLIGSLYHIPAVADPQFTPLSLGVAMLSNTPSGLLYKNLVEQKLSTSAFGYAAGLKQPGYALFMAELQEGMNQDQALEVLNNTVENQSDQLAEEDLERTRNQWLNSWAQIYADPAALASALSDSAAGGDWRLFFWQRDQVEQTQLNTIQQELKKWLVADNRTNGLYIPTDSPQRAPASTTPDVAALLEGYTGKESTSTTELFDPSPQNINASTQVEVIELSPELGQINVALLPKPTRGERVNAILSVRFGAPENLKGLSFTGTATADLLPHGTKQYSREQIEDRFTELQASVRFSGGANGVEVNIETTQNNLPAVISFVTEILRDASFPEAELQKYKAQRLTRISNARTEPSAIASQELGRHFNTWPKDDIRYTPSFDEAEEQVQALNAADLVAFHQNFYGTGDIRFSATGSFEPEAVKSALKTGFENWRQAPRFERAADPYQDIEVEHLVFNTPDKANAFFIEMLPLSLQDSDPDFVPLYLANYLLGQSETSRLWNRVRVTEGLSYDVRSRLNVSSYEPNATWVIYAIHAPENSQQLQTVINEELNQVIAEGFSEQEVQDGIHALLRYRALARANDGVLANTWQKYLDIDRDFIWAEEMDAALQKLDAPHVNAALQKHLKIDGFSSALAADQAKQN